MAPKKQSKSVKDNLVDVPSIGNGGMSKTPAFGTTKKKKKKKK